MGVEQPLPSAWWTHPPKCVAVPTENHVAVDVERPEPLVWAFVEVGMACLRALCARLYLHLQVVRSRRRSRHPRKVLVVRLGSIDECFGACSVVGSSGRLRWDVLFPLG